MNPVQQGRAQPAVQISPAVQKALISLGSGVALYAIGTISPYGSAWIQYIGFTLGMKGVYSIGEELKIVDAVSNKCSRIWKQITTPRQGSSLLGAACTVAVGSAIGGALGYFSPSILKEDLVVSPAITAPLGATAAWCVKSVYDLISGAPAVAQPVPAPPPQPAINFNGWTIGDPNYGHSYDFVSADGLKTRIYGQNQGVINQLFRIYDRNDHVQSINNIIRSYSESVPDLLILNELGQIVHGKPIPRVDPRNFQQSGAGNQSNLEELLRSAYQAGLKARRRDHGGYSNGS